MPFPLQEFMADKPAMTADQEKQLYTIQCDCYNNLAACLLQMPPVNYERVKHYSLKVLERQPDNVKALYRADVNVKHYLQLTKSQLSIYLQKEKQLYMGMFG
ncbi:putative Tetratricopeptide repeat protein [Naja naja]|nr:putative Tetratricopeptide repeat protein [Naja naja]